MVIIPDLSIMMKLNPCHRASMYTSCQKGRELSLGSLAFSFPLSCISTSVSSNLVGGLGHLPALPPMADPLETMMLEMLEPPTFVHSLSLLGATNPVSHLQWLFLHPEMGKETMPHRGERIERNLAPAFPHCRRHKAARIATVLVVDTYWGCTGTTTTSQYHFSVPCVHKKICTQKKLQVWPAQSWVKPHTAGSTRTAEKNSLVQAGYKPSGTEEFLVLSILPKDQRKGKASSRASSLFVSYSSVPATWHRKKSSWCHLTDFSCYTINGYFFFLCREMYASFECLYL